MDATKLRTTVSISKKTKARLDMWRVSGQCYDGFLSQMVELWEKMHPDYVSQKRASTRDTFTTKLGRGWNREINRKRKK